MKNILLKYLKRAVDVKELLEKKIQHTREANIYILLYDLRNQP